MYSSRNFDSSRKTLINTQNYINLGSDQSNHSDTKNKPDKITIREIEDDVSSNESKILDF